MILMIIIILIGGRTKKHEARQFVPAFGTMIESSMNIESSAAYNSYTS